MKLKTCHLLLQPAFRFVAGPLVVLCFQTILIADQFKLRDGRVLTGKLVSKEKFVKANPDKKSSPNDEQWIIEIDDGVQIAIHKSDLVLNGGYKETDPREQEYQKRAGGMDQSAETHYNVARWCTAEGLKDLAQAHYLRAIELNPDFSEARAAVEHKLSDTGRWVRVEDDMQRKGKIEVGTKWIYPEYAIEEKQKAEKEKIVKEHKKVIEAFHQAFIKGSPKADQALAAVEQLNDSIAMEIFASKLNEKVVAGKKAIPDALKLVYIRLLSKFDNPIATSALARTSVQDASQPIRNAALDVLAKQGRVQAIQMIRGLLGASNNEIVNRAGFALGKLNASEATLELINALVTKHEEAIRPEADTYTPNGTSFGGPKKAMVERKNADVYSALSQITKQGNLGYDKAAWINWYANVYASPVDDLRRDY